MTNSLICTECFNKSKNKHKNHNVTFKPEGNGFCDCGEASAIIKESFCPDHNGPFTNEKEIMDFISASIGENNTKKIDPLINNIFIEITKKIDELYNKNLENESKINVLNELLQMLDELLLFVSKLYESNLGFFYLVVLKFTKNYPFETHHKCFKYDENENKITIIKENLEEKHICTCPFFQVMIYLFMTLKTKYDNEEFFKLFIQTYKNYKISSLAYIHSFAQLHCSYLQSFIELGYQVLTPPLCKLIYNEKNNFFLENFFKEIYEKSKQFIKLKKYEEAYVLFFNFFQALGHLVHKQELNIFISNMNVHSTIIDIICLTNNLNVFEDKTQFTEFQREGYLNDLLNCEMDGIKISIILCYLIDFNNTETIKFIFNKIFNKLIEYKNYKENIPQKKYSPHISTIKYYSIFLNRFCFHYAFNNNSNLYDAFQYFLSLFPESRELNKFIFKDLIIYIGFMISQRYSFFNYFGEDMILYSVNYFNDELSIVQPDITLMKYLLTLPEIQQELNIDNFNNLLNYSNINHSNDFFLEFNQSLDNNKKEELNSKIALNEKNVKYINSLLDFILLIMKDNISMIKMAFKESDNFTMNYKDEIFEKLLLKEGKNLENLIRNEIIHFIIAKKNLIDRESCMTVYDFYDHNEIKTDFIINLLKENCNEIPSKNQLKLYSLKKEIFKFFDIDYIINYKDKSDAIKYISEFQSTNYNILNTYLIDPLSIQVILNEKIYDSFFNDNFLKFYEYYIISNAFPILTEDLFVTTSKFLCMFIKIYNNKANNFDILKEKLINIFLNCKLGEKYTDYIQYILKLLSKEEIITRNQKNEKLKKNLKDKIKRKFDKKMENVMENLSTISSEISDVNIIKINTNETEVVCIYCRQDINYDDLNTCAGKICFTIRDYFRDILKKIDEKLRKKTMRFITCNHNIHFKCYMELIVNNPFQILICPLCKKTCNAIFLDLSNIIKSKSNDGDNFFKGLNLEDENDISSNNSETIMNKYKCLIDYLNKFYNTYYYISLKEDYKYEKIYNLFLNNFDTFAFYYNITNHKSEQICIWKNILLSIKLICKYISNDLRNLLILKFKDIYKSLQELNFNYLIEFEISTLLNEFIICLFVLYDLDQKSKDKISSLFQNNILPYIFAYMLIQKKENNFKEFIKKEENKEFIQKIINFYNLKYKICFLLFDEREEDLKLNLDIDSIQYNETIQALINNNLNLTLKEQYIEYPNFEIISLPEHFIEFCPKYMSIECINCHKKIVDFYLCLVCGNKICDNKSCVTDIKPNGKKEYSLIEHSKI